MKTMRSVAATGLSLWLGILACVLGCATVKAAGLPEIQAAASAQCPDSDTGDSCCHHKRGPEKNQHSNSCCPSDIALIQKQNAGPALLHFFVAFFLTDFHASNFVSTNAPTSFVWHAGRDILLQVHVLRI